MSLLYTSYNGEDSYNLYCPKCRLVVMVGTQEEIGGLACAGIVPLCFDCHPGPADKVYPGLLDEKKQCYLVVIDGVPFMFEWVLLPNPERWNLLANRITWPTYCALLTGRGDNPPLSSSTNLNNLTHKSGG